MGFLCYVVSFLSWVIIDWLRGYMVYLLLFVKLRWISHRAGMVVRWNNINIKISNDDWIFFIQFRLIKLIIFCFASWGSYSCPYLI